MNSLGTRIAILWRLLAATAALTFVVAAQAIAADPYVDARLRMVHTIEAISSEMGGGATPMALSASVLDAMRRTPRHAFVPADLRDLAYADRCRSATGRLYPNPILWL